MTTQGAMKRYRLDVCLVVTLGGLSETSLGFASTAIVPIPDGLAA